MVGYRRNRVPGATYFFTVTLRDRQSPFLTEHIDALRAAWHTAKIRTPHRLLATVVLPEHLHALIEMPASSADYSRLWQDIKKGFTRRVLQSGVALAPRAEGGYALWQRRYWEHTIRDEADLEAHLAYVHYNPVKHGHVRHVIDWPHSSLHRWVAEGLVPPDWGSDPLESDVEMATGERR